ncbi:GNAT family N-acetyltransferase [candidate division KSB1 bacterium]|nr:GNAT family N-acetyltransferase [candidate division KSB1 bacterium]
MRSLLTLEKGQIYNLLEKSYDNWQDADKHKKDWLTYDNEVFDNPLTIGKCDAVTYDGDVPIGFVSWDPRNHPGFVIIGHNCILQEYIEKGFGKFQIKYACNLFMKQGFELVRVSTGSDLFFNPARKMYESVGFIRREAYRNDGPDMIYYEMLLKD